MTKRTSQSGTGMFEFASEYVKRPEGYGEMNEEITIPVLFPSEQDKRPEVL